VDGPARESTKGPSLPTPADHEGFVVDFYCHAAGLIVEVDGSVHEELADYDIERDRILSARGLYILRVTNEEVSKALPIVLARIAQVTANPSSADSQPD
jgi:very-short-patch-repair endonuclease